MQLAVLSGAGVVAERAEALAAALDLPVVSDPRGAGWLLVAAPTGLELRTGTRPPTTVRVDFVGGAMGYRRSRLVPRNELLARAVLGRQGPLAVLDATAGLGRDGFILASLGCPVTLLERSALVAALLADGLARGRADPATAPVCERMQLIRADAHQWLATGGAGHRPGVVYLDPMYPARRASARAGKEMQALQVLLGDDTDADGLLEIGRKLGRVVVKRPRLAPFLGDQPPDRQLGGRSTRFDIYLPVSR